MKLLRPVCALFVCLVLVSAGVVNAAMPCCWPKAVESQQASGLPNTADDAVTPPHCGGGAQSTDSKTIDSKTAPAAPEKGVKGGMDAKTCAKCQCAHVAPQALNLPMFELPQADAAVEMPLMQLMTLLLRPRAVDNPPKS